MRIALTGVTGLLGRNLLFEILKQNLGNLDDLEIIVLGRPVHTAPLDNRLQAIFEDDGYSYINIDPNNSSLIQQIKHNLISITFDLTKDDLDISKNDLRILKEKRIDHFFHVAALTDFRTGSSVEAKLNDVNVKGTQRILALVKQLDVGQFVYVSSAYACGSKTGLVEPDYVNLDENFRNPYEKSKLEAEILVRSFARENNLKFKIFRPSTICGRLIEKPIGAISKFDVFYAWAAFFARAKMKYIKSVQDLFSVRLEFKIRINVNPDAGLNIVPVDYAAKLMWLVSINDDEDICFHLANPEDTNHINYIKWMLESVGVFGYSFVDQEPKSEGEIEKFYYRTVGKIFTPYIVGEPIKFAVSNVKRFENKFAIHCPVINKDNFAHLMKFAKDRHFGMKI